MVSPPIGQLTERVNIIDISRDLACEVTTEVEHGFPNKSFVRLTGLGIIGPGLPKHGMDELNNNRYRIIVMDDTNFSLEDPITFEPIDSTDFVPYITGGSCNLVQSEFIFYPSPEQEFPN